MKKNTYIERLFSDLPHPKRKTKRNLVEVQKSPTEIVDFSASKEILDQIALKNQQIQIELDAVLKKVGLSAEEIRRFLSHSDQLGENYQKQISVLQKDYQKKLDMLFPEEDQKKILKKEQKKSGKKRKEKTLGSRKGWINMG